MHDAQTGEPLTEAIGSEYGFVFKTIDNRYISFEGSVSGEEYQSVWAFEKYFDLSSKKMVNYEELEPVNFKINLSDSKAYIAGTNVKQIDDFKKLNYNDRSKNLKLVAENGKIVPFNNRKVAVNLSSDQYLALTDNEGNPTFEFYSTKTGERVLKAGWNVFGERFKLMYLSEIAPDGHSLFIPKDGDRSAYLVYDLNASETTGYFTFSNYIQDGWSRFFSDIGIIKKVKTFSINGSFVIRKANSVSSSDPPIILKDNTILTYGIERLGESKTKLNFQAVNIASLEVVNEFSIVADRFEDALLGVRSDGEFLYIEGVKSKRVDGR